MTDVPVATAFTNGAGSFKVALPDTDEVRSAAVNGILTTLTVVKGNDRATGVYTSVAIPGSGEAEPMTGDLPESGQSIAEDKFPASVPLDAVTRSGSEVAPDDDTYCQWYLIKSYEGTSRIGELHVYHTGGGHGEFDYQQQADSTFTVGLEFGGDGWNAAGHHTVSNSIGSSAGYTEPNPAGYKSKTYAVDHMYFGKYEGNGSAACPGYQFKTEATHSTGDVFVGHNTPPSAPWSSCHADPYGYARVYPGGHYTDDQTQAKNYDYVDAVFGFTFGGHTGYTSGINLTLHASSVSTYVCGRAEPPKLPVAYNKSW